MRHAPGPWRIAKMFGHTYVAFASDSYVAQVYEDKNACLIAAAPELLEALITARVALKLRMRHDALPSELELMGAIDAAIQKAERGQA